MQNWYSLSDAAMENELLDIGCIRRVAGIDLLRADISDATKILAFRSFLKKGFAAVREHLREHSLMMSEGTVVDATILPAPTSSKDQKRERGAEMHSSRKENQWFFDMKAYIGVTQDSGLIHAVSTTGANVRHVTMGRVDCKEERG